MVFENLGCVSDYVSFFVKSESKGIEDNLLFLRRDREEFANIVNELDRFCFVVLIEIRGCWILFV